MLYYFLPEVADESTTVKTSISSADFTAAGLGQFGLENEFSSAV